MLQMLRVGYHNKRFRATVAAGDTVHVVLRVGHAPIVFGAVVVEVVVDLGLLVQLALM